MKRLILALPLIFFGAILYWFLFGLSRDAAIVPSALLQKPMPAITLPTLYDETKIITLNKEYFKNKKVSLVNIWASWCVPCKVEHPFLQQLAREYPIYMLGLNWKDTRQNANNFLQQQGDIYDVILYDKSARQSIELGVYGVPETYIIDNQGIIRYKHVGPILSTNIDDIRGVINALLNP